MTRDNSDSKSESGLAGLQLQVEVEAREPERHDLRVNFTFNRPSCLFINHTNRCRHSGNIILIILSKRLRPLGS